MTLVKRKHLIDPERKKRLSYLNWCLQLRVSIWSWHNFALYNVLFNWVISMAITHSLSPVIKSVDNPNIVRFENLLQPMFWK